MSREEFNELILYISDLKQHFNRKLDDQTVRINQQNLIIDELCWQLREMSAKVRNLNTNLVKTNKQFCNCVYENYFPMKNKHVDGGSSGSLNKNFNSSSSGASKNLNNISNSKFLNVKHNPNNSNHNNPQPNSKPNYIPPSTKDTGEAFDRALSPIYEPIDITAEIAKRNKTTDLDDDKAEAKEEYEVCDFLDEDNVLRQKKFKVFGSNSRRGSSKVLCSQISNYEENYLPTELELRDSNIVHLPRDSTESITNLRLTYIKDSISNSIDV